MTKHNESTPNKNKNKSKSRTPFKAKKSRFDFVGTASRAVNAVKTDKNEESFQSRFSKLSSTEKEQYRNAQNADKEVTKKMLAQDSKVPGSKAAIDLSNALDQRSIAIISLSANAARLWQDCNKTPTKQTVQCNPK